jgi:Arc/MetJ-type ribon-helix-helix transcriptional regulator
MAVTKRDKPDAACHLDVGPDSDTTTLVVDSLRDAEPPTSLALRSATAVGGAGGCGGWAPPGSSRTCGGALPVDQPPRRSGDNLAKYVDDRVKSGGAASRAEMIARALEELMRREEREREMALVDELNARNESLYPDLDGLAEWGAQRPMGID